MMCRCGSLATIHAQHAGRHVGYMCFRCANDFMVSLAPENVRGGSSWDDTVLGYMRWREAVGHPISVTAARAALRQGADETEK